MYSLETLIAINGVAHLGMRSGDGGLVAVAYAPSTVSTEIQGRPVELELQTNYPFDDLLRFIVRVEEPIRFPLHLRIPEWARGAEVQGPAGAVEATTAGTFHRVEHTWA